MTHTAERDRRDGEERKLYLKTIYDDAWNKAYRNYPKSGNDWRDDAKDYAERMAEVAQKNAKKDWDNKHYGRHYYCN